MTALATGGVHRLPVGRSPANDDATEDGDDARRGAAMVALAEGRLVDAVEHIVAAIRQSPNAPDLLQDAAALLRRAGQPAQARACLQRALDLAPASVTIRLGLAGLDRAEGRLAAALDHLAVAEALAPHEPEAPYAAGLALAEAGESTRAHAAFARAIRLRPHWPAALAAQAETLQALGRSAEAARLHDAIRRRHPPLPPPPHPWAAGLPRWDGSPLAGRTLLLDAGCPDAVSHHAEAIGGLRFAAIARARGLTATGRVVLAAPARLRRLCALVAGIDAVPDPGSADGAGEPLDIHLPLADLPMLPGLADAAPAAPWLRLPAPRAVPRPAPRPRIGLVWAGDNAALPARHLRTLVEGVAADVVALQRGPRAGDVVAEGIGHAIAPHPAQDGDALDDARVIAGLDLVIGVVSPEAALAAALGVPVWLLLAADAADPGWAAASFRREGSDWAGVCGRVRLALAGRDAAPAPERCKQCAEPAPFAGVTAWRGTEDGAATATLAAEPPVAWHRCEGCGLLFTRHRDHWTATETARRLQPPRADAEDRAWRQAQLLATLLPQAARLRVLIHGAGAARTARALAALGVHAASHDPAGDAPPAGRFDLIACFAALERALDPNALAYELAALLAPDAAVLLATLVQPEPPPPLDWWYVAPRDGHVAIQSRASLTRLWRTAGLSLVSLTDGTHLALRGRPAFARHLLGA